MRTTMRRTTSIWLVLALGIAAFASGCDLLTDDGDGAPSLKITIEADGRIASPTDSVLLTVTATNQGSTRVVWGRGSSSCQLGAVVRVGATRVPAADLRACTEDLSEQALLPGESRTESWPWNGQVLRKTVIEPLAPGFYKVFGAAGPWQSDSWVVIEVEGP